MPRRLCPCAYAAAAFVVALALGGCGGGTTGQAGSTGSPGAAPAGVVTTVAPAPGTAPAHQTYTAAIAKGGVTSVGVYDTPGDPTPAHSLPNPNPFYGPDFPRVFLVKEQRGDWLDVLLPMRPNGATGWIKRADVELDPPHTYRIVVELGEHRLSLYDKTDLIMQEPVGVGDSATPTTAGYFYTTELVKVLPDQQDAYGPFAFALSAYSEVHFNFAGGDGQMGIHGTGDPSSVGRDVSNGCIRLTNDAITALAHTIPKVGVPVEILA